MLVRICDSEECGQRAVFHISYARGQVPQDVCREHVAWLADIGMASNNGAGELTVWSAN